MELLDLPDACAVYTVLDHFKIKQSILDCIDSDPNYCLHRLVSKSDWTLPTEYPRNYSKFLSPIVDGLHDLFLNQLGYNQIQLQNYWFQQYTEGGFHKYHVHPGANFTSIYFVELPELELATRLYLPWSKTEIFPKVCEGQLLCFPGHIKHCSPVNVNGKRKTVIVNHIDVID